MGRRHLVGLGLVLGICILAAPEARAQGQLGGINVSDPFSLYFGYYLPHQAAIAAQATPLDTINAAQATRQAAAVRDRTGLFDPLAGLGIGDEDVDPTRPYARSSGRERLQRAHTFATSTTNARMRGNAPMPFYSRTHRYYPTLRAGLGANQNLAATRAGRYGSLPGR